MRVRRLLAVLALAPAALAPLRGMAWQAASPQAVSPANKPVELDPIIVDANDNISKAEVVLAIDLDSKGSLTHATAVSGPRDLVPHAIADAKMFRYPNQANASGLTQRILFRYSADEVHTVTPDYPPTAAKAHAAGVVKLIATVGPDGHVADVAVLLGHPLLQDTAQKALRQWVFKPVLKDGVATPCHAIVTFNFDLNRFPN